MYVRIWQRKHEKLREDSKNIFFVPIFSFLRCDRCGGTAGVATTAVVVVATTDGEDVELVRIGAGDDESGGGAFEIATAAATTAVGCLAVMMMRSLTGVKLNCFDSCFVASRRINATSSVAFESRLFVVCSSTRCGFDSTPPPLTMTAEDDDETDAEDDDVDDCVDAVLAGGGGAKQAMTSFRSRAFNSNVRIVSIVL